MSSSYYNDAYEIPVVLQAVPDDPGESYQFEFGTKGFWSIISPVGKLVRNNVANPSFELGTDGWVASIGTMMTRVQNGTSGAWRLHVEVAPGGNLPLAVAFQSGPVYPVMRIPVGTKFYGSVDVLVRKGAFYSITFQTASIALQQPNEAYVNGNAATGTGSGRWERIFFDMEAIDNGTGTADATVAIRIEVYDYNDNNPFFLVDSARAGFVPLADYFDGDSPGAQWTGAPHASVSYIDQFNTAYGERVYFNEIGFNLTAWEGDDMPSFETISTPYAQLHGSNVQSQRVTERLLTLTGDWHACETTEMFEQLQKFFRLIRPRFSNQCPAPLYLEFQLRDCNNDPASNTLQVPVYYESGAEGAWRNPNVRRGAIQFKAYEDMMWRTKFSKAAILSANSAQTVNYLGNEDAWVQARIYTIDNLAGTITSITNNDTTNTIQFGVPNQPLTIAAGSYYKMDTTPRYGRFELVSAGPATNAMSQVRLAESDFSMFRLVPGTNELLVIGSSNVRVALEWKEAYTSTAFVDCSATTL